MGAFWENVFGKNSKNEEEFLNIEETGSENLNPGAFDNKGERVKKGFDSKKPKSLKDKIVNAVKGPEELEWPDDVSMTVDDSLLDLENVESRNSKKEEIANDSVIPDPKEEFKKGPEKVKPLKIDKGQDAFNPESHNITGENWQKTAAWEQNPMGNKKPDEVISEKENKSETKTDGLSVSLTRKKEEGKGSATEEVKAVFVNGKNARDVGGEILIDGKAEEIIEVRKTKGLSIFITKNGTYEISNEKIVESKIKSAEDTNKEKEEGLSKEKRYSLDGLKGLFKGKKRFLIAAAILGLAVAVPAVGVMAGFYGMGLAQAFGFSGILYGDAALVGTMASYATGVAGGYGFCKLMSEARKAVTGEKKSEGSAEPENSNQSKPKSTNQESVEPIIPENINKRLEEIKKRKEQLTAILNGAEKIEKEKESLEKSLKDLQKGADSIQEGINNLGESQKEAKKHLEDHLALIKKDIEEIKKQIQALDIYLSGEGNVDKIKKEIKDITEEENNIQKSGNKPLNKGTLKVETSEQEDESEELFDRYDGTGQIDGEDSTGETSVEPEIIKKETISSDSEKIEYAFKSFGSGAKEGAINKTKEYDERIRAAKDGNPIIKGDTEQQLLIDFKSWTKQEWDDNFNIDNFQKIEKRKEEILKTLQNDLTISKQFKDIDDIGKKQYVDYLISGITGLKNDDELTNFSGIFFKKLKEGKLEINNNKK
jgi:hypothetical protein